MVFLEPSIDASSKYGPNPGSVSCKAYNRGVKTRQRAWSKGGSVASKTKYSNCIGFPKRNAVFVYVSHQKWSVACALSLFRNLLPCNFCLSHRCGSSHRACLRNTLHTCFLFAISALCENNSQLILYKHCATSTMVFLSSSTLLSNTRANILSRSLATLSSRPPSKHPNYIKHNVRRRKHRCRSCQEPSHARSR